MYYKQRVSVFDIIKEFMGEVGGAKLNRTSVKYFKCGIPN